MSRFTKSSIRRRAATEGRPYSTSGGARFDCVPGRPLDLHSEAPNLITSGGPVESGSVAGQIICVPRCFITLVLQTINDECYKRDRNFRHGLIRVQHSEQLRRV